MSNERNEAFARLLAGRHARPELGIRGITEMTGSLGKALGKGLAIAAMIWGASVILAPVAHAGETLDKIKARGVIKVGVGTSPGFFAPDSAGRWQGFFVDFGRALAITVFNDPEKVEFTSSSPQQRLPALQAG